MFEFEIQTWRHIRIRIGRWHIRTWRSSFLRLPRGYRSPEICWAVEQRIADDSETPVVQLGAFFSEREATACKNQLVREGAQDVMINVIPVHVRLADWDWDR